MKDIIITKEAKSSLEMIKDKTNIGIIYGHYNLVEDKWYIGQTIHWDNPYKRWGNDGKKYLNNTNSKFSDAIRNFRME